MTGRITWFASFGIAVKVALGLWSINYDWVTKFITAAVTCVVLPDMVFGEAADPRGVIFEGTAR